MEGSALVRRNTRMPLSARRARSGPAARTVAGLGELRDERGPRPHQARVGELHDRPQIAQAVLDGRAGQGDPTTGFQPLQLLRGLAGGVLDGLRFVEHDLAPRDLAERVHVPHGGAVGRDDHVGIVGQGLELVRRRTIGAVMHPDVELRREAGGLGGPVPDDRRRRHDEGCVVSADLVQVGQQGRGLAQAHVQRQATAQSGAMKESQPHQRLGLVAAELAFEPVGGRVGVLGDVLGTGQELGGPVVAGQRDAAQRRPLEAERMAQHVGARELRRVGSFGQRGGRLGQVGMIQLDPLPARLHQRFGFPGQPLDILRRELDVVEDRTPPHVGQLLCAHDGLGGVLRGQPQLRGGLATGQRRDPDIEAGGGQRLSLDGHQVPCLVLAEDHLAPTASTGSEQLGEDPLEPLELVLHFLAAGV